MSSVLVSVEIEINNEVGFTLGDVEQLVDDLISNKLEGNEDVVEYAITKVEHV